MRAGSSAGRPGSWTCSPAASRSVPASPPAQPWRAKTFWPATAMPGTSPRPPPGPWPDSAGQIVRSSCPSRRSRDKRACRRLGSNTAGCSPAANGCGKPLPRRRWAGLSSRRTTASTLQLPPLSIWPCCTSAWAGPEGPAIGLSRPWRSAPRSASSIRFGRTSCGSPHRPSSAPQPRRPPPGQRTSLRLSCTSKNSDFSQLNCPRRRSDEASAP